MGQGFHKVHRKNLLKRNRDSVIDDCMYAVGVISPILTIPQILQIWSLHKIQGVSLLTWSGYTVMSGVWLLYGLHRKEKPIIFANILSAILDFLIVLGILLQK